MIAHRTKGRASHALTLARRMHRPGARTVEIVVGNNKKARVKETRRLREINNAERTLEVFDKSSSGLRDGEQPTNVVSFVCRFLFLVTDDEGSIFSSSSSSAGNTHDTIVLLNPDAAEPSLGVRDEDFSPFPRAAPTFSSAIMRLLVSCISSVKRFVPSELDFSKLTPPDISSVCKQTSVV
jgi:hypothetical protein